MEGFIVIKIDSKGRVSLAVNQVEANAIQVAKEELRDGAVQAAVVPGRLFGNFAFEVPDGE